MVKSALIGLVLLFSATAASAGYNQCQTYACAQAQQEIMYLYDAIWRERQKQFPCWVCIEDAQRRIEWLQQIQ